MSTPSSPTAPPKTQLRAPAEPQWLEHPTLFGLRDRLQLVYDGRSLLEFPDGTSRRPVYLPRGIEEPETCCLKQREAARPTGFYRDALRTYAGMLSRLAWHELPESLTRVATDVDGQGILREGGHDPNSACNVIGADDWAADRIMPDAMRALAARAGSRPPALTRLLSWRDGSDPHAPHEAGRLHLQIDKAHHRLGWQPRWRAPARMGTGSWRPTQSMGARWPIAAELVDGSSPTTEPSAQRHGAAGRRRQRSHPVLPGYQRSSPHGAPVG